MKLFNRYLRLELNYLVKQPAGNWGDSYDLRSTKTIKDLRVSFNIENTFLGDYGLASFDIYNLNAESLSWLQASNRNTKITCYAGYQEEGAPTLFSGRVTNIITLRKGVDTVTTIYARDGSDIGTFYPSDGFSFPRESTPKQLIDALIKDDHQTRGTRILQVNYIGDAKEKLNAVKDIRLSFDETGQYSDLFKKILPYNFRVSFYRGVVNIRRVLQEGELSKLGAGERAEDTLSVDTGLLEFPTINYYAMELKHMLRPNLIPGSVINVRAVSYNINVESAFYERREDLVETNQLFRIMSVRHVGDNRDNQWSTEIEAFAAGV